MGAIARITVKDGSATPVDVNYDPTTPSGNIITFQDRATGIIVGMPDLVIDQRPGNQKNGAQRTAVRTLRPTLEQTSPSTSTGIQPAPTLAYSHFVKTEMVSPIRGTRAERVDALARHINLLNHALVKAILTDGDLLY